MFIQVTTRHFSLGAQPPNPVPVTPLARFARLHAVEYFGAVLVGSVLVCGGVAGCASWEADPRVTAEVCEYGERTRMDLRPTPGFEGCRDDSECTEGVEGRCTKVALNRGVCTYHDCRTNEDCAANERCVCAADPDGRNRCLADDCDCPDSDCAVVVGCGSGAGGVPVAEGLECRSRRDRCTHDDECAEGEFCTPYEDDTRDRARCFRCERVQCNDYL